MKVHEAMQDKRHYYIASEVIEGGELY